MGETVRLKRGNLKDALVSYAMDAAEAGHVETMSLRKAARDLGVSSGAAYRHFPDKDTLLGEIVSLGFDDLREIFLTIRPENDTAQSLETVLKRSHDMTDGYIRFAFKKPALWHMMFGRIGNKCRDEEMVNEPEKMRYTPMDATSENLKDLYRLGYLETPPTLSDVRYIWSATHGAADLAQSGLRLDSDQLDQIIQETTDRNLRAIGYSPAQ